MCLPVTSYSKVIFLFHNYLPRCAITHTDDVQALLFCLKSFSVNRIICLRLCLVVCHPVNASIVRIDSKAAVHRHIFSRHDARDSAPAREYIGRNCSAAFPSRRHRQVAFAKEKCKQFTPYGREPVITCSLCLNLGGF